MYYKLWKSLGFLSLSKSTKAYCREYEKKKKRHYYENKGCYENIWIQKINKEFFFSTKNKAYLFYLCLQRI